jgi:hypothetical protein
LSFSSENPGQQFKGGDDPARVTSARAANAVAADVSAVKRHLARTIGPYAADAVITPWHLGVIYQTSETPEYTDARYEVQISRVAYARKYPEQITLEEDQLWDESRRVVIATNLAETETGSHGVPVGHPVHLFIAYVQRPIPETHYFFVSPPQIRWGKASGDWEWSTATVAVSLMPVVSDTDPTPTGEPAVSVTLASATNQVAKQKLAHPPTLIETDDIIPFFMTGDGVGRALPLGTRVTATVTLAPTSDAADTTNVSAAYKKSVTDTRIVRAKYVPADLRLYGYTRVYVDECGNLITESAETRATIIQFEEKDVVTDVVCNGDGTITVTKETVIVVA